MSGLSRVKHCRLSFHPSFCIVWVCNWWTKTRRKFIFGVHSLPMTDITWAATLRSKVKAVQSSQSSDTKCTMVSSEVNRSRCVSTWLSVLCQSTTSNAYLLKKTRISSNSTNMAGNKASYLINNETVSMLPIYTMTNKYDIKYKLYFHYIFSCSMFHCSRWSMCDSNIFCLHSVLATSVLVCMCICSSKFVVYLTQSETANEISFVVTRVQMLP